jgi:1,2-dihydroxy-3-keto-5-methylthiopentene dioxygenase
MKAYWFDNRPVRNFIVPKGVVCTENFLQGDQRENHDSGRAIDKNYLRDLGVIYHRCPSIDEVDAIAKERSYKNRDEITVSPDKMGDAYEDKVKIFFNEHLHEDEEIRYILDGEGFFDVRSETDDWVRIKLEKDDLIILPAGIYHRFTTDANNVSRRCVGKT